MTASCSWRTFGQRGVEGSVPQGPTNRIKEEKIQGPGGPAPGSRRTHPFDRLPVLGPSLPEGGVTILLFQSSWCFTLIPSPCEGLLSFLTVSSSLCHRMNLANPYTNTQRPASQNKDSNKIKKKTSMKSCRL